MLSGLHIDALAGAMVYAAIFLFGGFLHLPASFSRYHRRAISFSGGIAVAYVFVHLLPELSATSQVFVESVDAERLRFPVERPYFAAMLGFLCFYGLEHLTVRGRAAEGQKGGLGFRLHIFGFALYVWMVSYLRVNRIEESSTPVVLYIIALGFHFLSTDHALRREHGKVYDRIGRFVLAAASLLGWVSGIFMEMPIEVVLTLLGFVSGGVILNSTLSELPREKEGNFWAFVLGALAYTAVLLPLG